MRTLTTTKPRLGGDSSLPRMPRISPSFTWDIHSAMRIPPGFTWGILNHCQTCLSDNETHDNQGMGACQPVA